VPGAGGDLVGTRQPALARLENGSSLPSPAFLDRIAKALDARIELHGIPPALRI